MPTQNPNAPASSGKATFSLILGILAIICVPLNILPAIPGVILGLLGVREIGRSGGAMTGKGLAITGIILNGLGLLCGCGFLGGLPFGYFRYVEAKTRVVSQNNLRQLALANFNYSSTYQDRMVRPIALPGTTEPLMSWRVNLLPYVEEDMRYRRFNMMEAWDKGQNKALLDPTPKPYVDPYIPETTSVTHYRVFVGPGALFSGPGDQSPYTIANIPDGTSNTILCVQATDGVPWSKQDELTYQPGQTLSRLGPPGKDFFLVAMCDGSVRVIKKTVSEQTLRNAIDPKDGQPLGPDW